jgi:hypothetical protein
VQRGVWQNHSIGRAARGRAAVEQQHGVRATEVMNKKLAQQHQYNGDDSALEIVTLMDLANAGMITFDNDDTDYQRILEEDITITD